MLDFDIEGNLTPYSVIESDLEELEKIFVKDIPTSQTRQRLFENYLLFIDSLKVIIPGVSFYQWINGSFVTSKTNPNDIDLVTFIEAKVFEERAKEIDGLRKIKFDKTKGIDCYFIKVYPKESKSFIFTQSDSLEWLDLFSHTRPDRNSQKKPKGFLKLNF